MTLQAGRTSMTVAGQPTVTYTYDNANRLVQIMQGTSTVAFTYDTAGRRTSLTLPNGVLVEYAYDRASRVTGITYKKGVTVLGNLVYQYDKAGNRTQIGGTFARTGLPAALASATYNAANQLTQWGTTTLSYDFNGNLTNDGSKSYTWNARNQLASMTGASFVYDGLGRRSKKTIGASVTEFLYDGVNPVQELSGTTVLANILGGLGIDEVFVRTDSAGARNFLTDALSSMVALTDSTGTIQTEYTYEPFGRTTATGAASSNPSQFTGRENDATGLYYYRARYYHPAFQRFISKDPLEFGGGDINLYVYVGNNPATFVDPLGWWRWWYHRDLTREQMQKLGGFSEWDIAIAAEANKQMDTRNLLAMINPWGDPRHYDPGHEAGSKQFICEKLQEAITLDRYGYRDSAMRALGQGLHTVQDAPAHAKTNPPAGWWRHRLGDLRLIPHPDEPESNKQGWAQARRDTERYLRDFQRGSRGVKWGCD